MKQYNLVNVDDKKEKKKKLSHRRLLTRRVAPEYLGHWLKTAWALLLLVHGF